MVHWKTKEKIKANIEAIRNNSVQEKELTKNEIEVLNRYINKHYNDKPKNRSKTPIGSIAGRAHFSASNDNFKETINERQKNRKTFTSYLLEKLSEREMTMDQLCLYAYLPQSIKSKVNQNKKSVSWQPDKDTVIKMGMAMHLSREDMDKLLTVAGYALTENDTKDIVIMLCIEKKEYMPIKINNLVFYAAKIKYYSF